MVKKILAAILCIAMLASLVIIPAYAAPADEIASDTILTEATVGNKAGITVDWKLKTGSVGIATANVVYAFDTRVFDLVDSTGTVVPIPDVSNVVVNSAQLETTEGWDMENNLCYEAGGANTAIIYMTRGKSNGVYTSADFATLGKFHLAYKAGKSKNDVTANALREATPAEAEGVSQYGALMIGIDLSNVLYYKSIDESEYPSTEGWASKVNFGKDFEFAKDPLPGTASVSISGDAIFDSTLTATPASFPGDAGTLTYTWYRGTSAIAGANAATYKLVAADVGQKIKVAVSAANYSGAAESAQTDTVDKKAYSGAGATAPAAADGFPTDTAITVTPVSGQEYAIVAKDATAPDDTATWNTTGAFTELNANTAYDVYTRVAATGTVKASGTAKTTITTTKSNPVVTAPTVKTGLVFNNTDQALITAGSSEHGTLKYALGTDSAAGSDWKTNAADITGKNAGSYYVWYKLEGDSTHSDVAPTKLTVTIGKKSITGANVTATTKLTYSGSAQTPANTNTVVIDGLTATGAWSEITNVGDTSTFTANGNFEGTVTSTELMDPAAVTGAPTIDGTVKFGQTLTANTGAMNPTTGYTYQWKADNAAISGATSATYKLTADEVGKTITVEVTCTNGNYTSTPVLSAATAAVAQADAPTGVKASYSAYHGDTTAKTVAAADFNLPEDIVDAAITAATNLGGDDVLAAAPTATGYQLKGGLSADDANKKATWKVTITSKNYGDITADVEVTVIDMVVVWTAVDALFPAGKSVVYGTKVSEMAALPASGTASIGSQSGQAGTFSYVSGDSVPEKSDSVTVTVKFTLTADTGKTATKDYTVKVTAKPVTVTGITVPNKVYNAKTAVTGFTGGTVSGTVGSDAVTVDLDNATGATATADVGANLTVTMSNVALSGAKAGNYTLSAQPTDVKVTVTAKPITTNVTISAGNKTYDGGTTATLSFATPTLNSVETEDDGKVSLVTTGVTGTFDNKNVGTGKAVTVAGDFTLAGEKAGNYTLTQPTKTGVTANITAADVTAVNTANQNVVVGKGEFKDAVINGVGSETNIGASGTFTYAVTGGATVAAGSDKDAVVNALKDLAKGDTAQIAWTWTPAGGSNYNGTTGTISVKMVDILFLVGEDEITEADITFKKASPVYGDTWAQIVDLTMPGVVAKLDGAVVSGSYFMSTDGTDDIGTSKPNAGQNVAFSVYFDGDDCDPVFVISGTVDVAKMAVKVTIKNQTVYLNGDVPDLSAPKEGTHYTVSKMVDEDKLSGEAVLEYQQDGAKVEVEDIDTSKTGSYDIVLKSGLTAPNGNYEVSVTNGKLNITRRSSGGGDRGGADSGETGKPATSTETMPDGSKVTTTTDGDTVTAVVNVPGRLETSKVKVPVGSADNNMVPVVVKPDGSEEVVRFSAPVENGVAMILTSSASIKLVKHDHTFVDTTTHWAKDNVSFVHARELFNGVDATHFAPDSSMTRSMIATVLYRLDGEKQGDVTAAFNDVASGTWYTDAVGWASERGIVNGYDDATFAPDDNVTREQLAAMIYRYAQVSGLVMMPRSVAEMDFADADKVSDWAVDAMSWALTNGILTGKPGKIADPSGYATRAEVATVLERFVKFVVK